MGGDITLESEPGRGSRFLLTLPLDSRSAEASVGTTELGERSDGELVLLSIDDDPSVSPLLQKMLGDQGYRVVGSTDPSRAASDARSLMPAAILLDLLMPGRDGRDILRELKSDPVTRAIPVIVVTVVDAADAPDLADGHVAKPLTRERLLRELRSLDPTPQIDP